jgi:hypothetical protein
MILVALLPALLGSTAGCGAQGRFGTDDPLDGEGEFVPRCGAVLVDPRTGQEEAPADETCPEDEG